MNILDLFNWGLDHKVEIIAVSTSVHVAATHVYLFVCHQGGLRTLWSNFIGPAPISFKEKLLSDEATYQERASHETMLANAQAALSRPTPGISVAQVPAEAKSSAPVATVSQPVAEPSVKPN